MKTVLDKIVIKEEKKEKITKGGIIMQESEQKSVSAFGTVIAVGPGTEAEPMKVKVGDKVTYLKNSAIPVEFIDSDEKVFVLYQRNILIYN